MTGGPAIAVTIAWSLSSVGRSRLVTRQVAVPVAIKRLERCGRICYFAGGQFAVTVRIKGQDDRIPRHVTALPPAGALLPPALRSALGATLGPSHAIRTSPDAALALFLAWPTGLPHPPLILLLPLW